MSKVKAFVKRKKEKEEKIEYLSEGWRDASLKGENVELVIGDTPINPKASLKMGKAEVISFKLHIYIHVPDNAEDLQREK